MTHRKHRLDWARRLLCLLAMTAVLWSSTALGDDGKDNKRLGAEVRQQFQQDVKPLLGKFCLRCHNPDKMTSGIRLDQLDGTVEQQRLFLWDDVLLQVETEAMPPEGQKQPTSEQRAAMAQWIRRAKQWAQQRDAVNNGATRRLTVSQYRNTLQSLLGIREDLTDILPPDAVSKDGFTNNSRSMVLSPLQLEAYFTIAERAIDQAVVDVQQKPTIQNFRVNLGRGINAQPCPDKLILGANSHLLANEDFQVVELEADKSFPFTAFRMRRKYQFNEGYQGNSTVRGLREYDSIYHAVFACMRGSRGYPLGRPFATVADGLLLRPAIPSPELFGQSSTYGPHANFKISLRELPDHGNFRITVRAARYEDALLLDRRAPLLTSEPAVVVDTETLNETQPVFVESATDGVFQVEVSFVAGKSPDTLTLDLGGRQFARKLFHDHRSSGSDEHTTAMLVVRLPKGKSKIALEHPDKSRLRRVTLRPVAADSELGRRFAKFESRRPLLGVYLGLRRDCGSTLARVGHVKRVESTTTQTFVFEGAINDYPSPDVQEDNDNYLAGVREIGVRSEFTDGRDMPRLRIESVEFEGPLYKTWPPESHRRVFFDSARQSDPGKYAREILRRFATRAFRRPVTEDELALFHRVWERSFSDEQDMLRSVKDALLVVLTSPQFLFLIENSESPKPEDIGPWELASKLSYFLWNGPPDQRLLDKAASGKLRQDLEGEVRRMLRDDRRRRFTSAFTSEWLQLNKLEVLEVDRKRYPKLTRDTKVELRKEPEEFFDYLLRENLPLRTLIDSDFIVANEVVAHYYGLGAKTERGFQFAPVAHQGSLGGLLTQAGILAGLSDGRESNPVKRGAWFARKIIAEPPDDPPPNVPQLPEEEDSGLTLRQKLEKHRDQEGCAKCHQGIDPWGMPFEAYDAGGQRKPTASQPANVNEESETYSVLPDGAVVDGVEQLRQYLLRQRLDQVAFSYLKHIATYAVGRSLTYNEIALLREKAIELQNSDCRLADLIVEVVKSEVFLKK